MFFFILYIDPILNIERFFKTLQSYVQNGLRNQNVKVFTQFHKEFSYTTFRLNIVQIYA